MSKKKNPRIKSAKPANMARKPAPHRGNIPSPQEIDRLVAHFSEGLYREAAALAQAMTVRFPSYGLGWKVLGVALILMGRKTEALAAMQRTVALSPGDAEAHSNLGGALLDLGRLDDAVDSFRRALEIEPDYADVHSYLGSALRQLGRLDEALASCRRAVAIKPDSADAHCNLGNVLQDLGGLDDALASYRRALEIDPDDAEAYSSLIFTHSYLCDLPAATLLENARHYGRLVASKVKTRFSHWTCPPHPERLRIGLVSGDLHHHPVGYFLESVLAQLDRAELDLIAYPTRPKTDALTDRIKPYFGAWKPLLGLSDEAAARSIRADGVHILLDLAGHTGHARLPVFAWKPAPVQASWLGYFATTGVPEMDYVLADPHAAPAGEDGHFTERLWRLPETRLCFTPPDVDVEVAALPALRNGYVTFGCFNNLAKINDAVVALWSRVLLAVPGSRLFLKSKPLNDASMRESTLQRFAGHGIAADRLIVEHASSRAEYLAAYHRVDIALDPFPYPGGTTSAEGLWMGVPVITKRGDRFLSRQGESIAHNAGLPDWIAADEEDYLAKAVAHAADLDRLATLRAGLRRQVLASPLFDAARFAWHFEQAMWGMWSRWLAQTGEA